jgi:hypothetical protein
VLVLVGDGEGDLRRVTPSADELRDCGRPRIAGDVRDERVVAAVDSRQLLEVSGGKARLGRVESPPP